MSLTWPVIAKITQQFATNPNSIQPNGHTGMDFAVAVGTSVKAAGAGTVLWADWATKLSASNPWWIAPAYAGIVVVIDHGNGMLTLYAHLDSTRLNVGNRVAQGQEIGKSGNTGLSSGPHLHFEIIGWPLKPYNNFYGRLNPNIYVKAAAPATPPLKANQRLVGPTKVNMRAEANSKAKIVREILPNTVETFTGYVIGERINGMNLWYKDAQGYAWCGGFTTQVTTGLKNLTPVKPPVVLDPKVRTVGADNTNRRAKPSTSAAVISVIPAKSSIAFTHFVKGESVKGIDIWFKDTKGYAWAGGFTSQATTGLTEEKTVVTPTPAPVPVPTPVPVEPKGYVFDKDFDFVEYKPAHITNVQRAADNPGEIVFPSFPEAAAIHQFDAKAKRPSIDGVINHFATERPGSESSAHFSVSGKRIVQHVSLKDRAFHAGRVGNDYVGIETDPQQDPDTIESTKKLLRALKGKYGYELITKLHKEISGNSTNCGAEIKLSDYVLNSVVTPPPVIIVPPAEPTPNPTPEPTPAVDEEAVIDDFLAYLKEEFFKTR